MILTSCALDRVAQVAGSAPGGAILPVVGKDRVEVLINDSTDWDEIAELIKESYRMLAPKKLIALLD
jgi:hypothetical protein